MRLSYRPACRPVCNIGARKFERPPAVAASAGVELRRFGRFSTFYFLRTVAIAVCPLQSVTSLTDDSVMPPGAGSTGNVNPKLQRGQL
jgi:hypothetical protein